jgi:penicillin-binding protein 2
MNYKVKKSYGSIETHEVFLDTLAKVKEEEFSLSEKKFEVKISEKIIYIIFALFILSSLVLFARTFYFQVFEGKQLSVIAENNKGRINVVRAERGIIYDKNLKKLVLNSPAYDFVCDKRNISSTDSRSINELSNISGILGSNLLDIENTIANSDQSKVVIAENISQEQLLVLEAKMEDFPDCQIEKNTVRNYVMGPIFSHVLGYMGKVAKDDLQNSANYTSSDYVGKVGLEKSYESYLRGTPAKVEDIKNALGVTKGQKIITPATSGDNLVLNIDANLQQEVYNALEKSIKNIGSSKGAAVALDPNTGAVLALVSYPAYDDNIFSNGISQADFAKVNTDASQPFFDRAISAQYPTGSTIKPFEASGALQEKIIDPLKLINDPGYILVHSQYDPNVVYRFGGVKPHGLVDMRKAIAVSSNIYFYTVGGGYGDQQGLGPTRIKKYLDLFGWEQKTGIDLPGEYPGFVPTPAWKKSTKGIPWSDGDTYNLAIGQSDLQVTPIQVADAYASIANGGTLYQPQIVNRVINNSPNNSPDVVKEFSPHIIRQDFIDPQNLEIVREGMRDGVQKDYGSSFVLNDLPVPVAAKTGTAETGKANSFNTWTASFAPYDKPQIVFVATIEGVNGLRAATLPVAHDVLQWYFTQHK